MKFYSTFFLKHEFKTFENQKLLFNVFLDISDPFSYSLPARPATIWLSTLTNLKYNYY